MKPINIFQEPCCLFLSILTCEYIQLMIVHSITERFYSHTQQSEVKACDYGTVISQDPNKQNDTRQKDIK